MYNIWYIELDVIALVYNILREMAARPRAQEETVAYLAACLSGIVKKRDTVLICFPEQGENSLSQVMEQAVLRCEASPVVWGADHRWKSLLRLAFSSRAVTIISTPLIVLGLAKLRSFYSIPLFVRNVVTSGYPCEEWMIDGIRRGFDCDSWGCFGIGTTNVVAGFSCDAIRGIHIRDTVWKSWIRKAIGCRKGRTERLSCHLLKRRKFGTSWGKMPAFIRTAVPAEAFTRG